MVDIAYDVANPFIYQLTAHGDDCDAQGHVNNAVYVRWMDEAAYAHSAALGYDWDRYKKLGASFVVRRHEVDYLSPAFANDQIVVATWPCVMEKFNATRRHQLVRKSDGVTLARAHTDWVYLDLETGRPQRIPQQMIDAFLKNSS